MSSLSREESGSGWRRQQGWGSGIGPRCTRRPNVCRVHAAFSGASRPILIWVVDVLPAEWYAQSTMALTPRPIIPVRHRIIRCCRARNLVIAAVVLLLAAATYIDPRDRICPSQASPEVAEESAGRHRTRPSKRNPRRPAPSSVLFWMSLGDLNEMVGPASRRGSRAGFVSPVVRPGWRVARAKVPSPDPDRIILVPAGGAIMAALPPDLAIFDTDGHREEKFNTFSLGLCVPSNKRSSRPVRILVTSPNQFPWAPPEIKVAHEPRPITSPVIAAMRLRCQYEKSPISRPKESSRLQLPTPALVRKVTGSPRATQ